jgi:4-diphosphocytidyl-2-C-methyl-D-erythritol kinase
MGAALRIASAGDLLEVRAPAKLNLYLEVLGRRPDGYHELETILQAVSLYDRLTFRKGGGGLRFSVTGSFHVPVEGNLVERAYQEICAAAGKPLGVEVVLEKEIPVGAGLGGGSSDAAAVLAGLNVLFELGLPDERLSELSAELGSDVPFFLCAGETALCLGRGERCSSIPSGTFHYVLCCPPHPLATADVYRRVKIPLTLREGGHRLVGEALQRGDPCALGGALFNRLEEAADGVRPEGARERSSLRSCGLEGVAMSGSGSAFFGVAQGKRQAQEVAQRLRAKGAGLIRAVHTT